jgi:hypothetical protein
MKAATAIGAGIECACLVCMRAAWAVAASCRRVGAKALAFSRWPALARMKVTKEFTNMLTKRSSCLATFSFAKSQAHETPGKVAMPAQASGGDRPCRRRRIVSYGTNIAQWWLGGASAKCASAGTSCGATVRACRRVDRQRGEHVHQQSHRHPPRMLEQQSLRILLDGIHRATWLSDAWTDQL